MPNEEEMVALRTNMRNGYGPVVAGAALAALMLGASPVLAQLEKIPGRPMSPAAGEQGEPTPF